MQISCELKTSISPLDPLVDNSMTKATDSKLTELVQARLDLQKYGYPKKTNSPNNSDLDLVVRTMMRYPHPKTLEILYALHSAIQLVLKDQSDEGLQWLLNGLSTCVSNFKDVDALKRFLAIDPRQAVSTSYLITGIQNLLTAISYRSILASWCLEPRYPRTIDQKKIFSAIRIFSQTPLPGISKTYPDRWPFRKLYPDNFIETDEFLSDIRPELSDCSEGEEDFDSSSALPQNVFKKTFKDKSTWVFAAKEANIPVRATVSGTTPLVLTTTERLLADTNLFKNIEDIKLFAGAILIPTYFRADYHGCAETFAGVHHYLKYRFNEIHEEFVTPYSAFKQAMELLVYAAHEEHKLSIQAVTTSILSQTKETDYVPVTHSATQDYNTYPPYWDYIYKSEPIQS